MLLLLLLLGSLVPSFGRLRFCLCVYALLLCFIIVSAAAGKKELRFFPLLSSAALPAQTYFLLGRYNPTKQQHPSLRCSSLSFLSGSSSSNPRPSSSRAHLPPLNSLFNDYFKDQRRRRRRRRMPIDLERKREKRVCSSSPSFYVCCWWEK